MTTQQQYSSLDAFTYGWYILNDFFIAAPFGNWIKPKGCIPVCGTFTLHSQGNRVWSAIKSLRYSTKHKGWMNNMGLPNPGVKVGLHKHIRGEVLSIAEIERNDFKKLYNVVPSGMSVELNLSCPCRGTQQKYLLEIWRKENGAFAKYPLQSHQRT